MTISKAEQTSERTSSGTQISEMNGGAFWSCRMGERSPYSSENKRGPKWTCFERCASWPHIVQSKCQRAQ